MSLSTNLSTGFKWTLAIVVLLLAARIAAPSAVVWYVNDLLEKQDGISGQVRDIDLALWRGGYVINQIDINQVNDKETLPLFSAQRIDILLSWLALLNGEIVTSMAFYHPVIMLRDKTGEQDITEDAVLDERTWIGLANDLTPFSIDKLTVEKGKIEFNAIAKNLLGELILDQVEAEVLNLHNNAESELLTQVDIKGVVAETANFFIKGKFNPNVKQPNFDLNMEMEKLPAKVADNIITIYAPFDIEAGEFELATELVSKKGQVTGYVKAGIHNVEIFSWKEDVIKDVMDGDENPLQLLIEGISARRFSS